MILGSFGQLSEPPTGISAASGIKVAPQHQYENPSVDVPIFDLNFNSPLHKSYLKARLEDPCAGYLHPFREIAN